MKALWCGCVKAALFLLPQRRHLSSTRDSLCWTISREIWLGTPGFTCTVLTNHYLVVIWEQMNEVLLLGFLIQFKSHSTFKIKLIVDFLLNVPVLQSETTWYNLFERFDFKMWVLHWELPGAWGRNQFWPLYNQVWVLLLFGWVFFSFSIGFLPLLIWSNTNACLAFFFSPTHCAWLDLLGISNPSWSPRGRWPWHCRGTCKHLRKLVFDYLLQLMTLQEVGGTFLLGIASHVTSTRASAQQNQTKFRA